VLAEDKLFATLDPRSRRLDLSAALEELGTSTPGVRFHHGTVPPPPPEDGETASAEFDDADSVYVPRVAAPSREVIMTDTVGFIRELPKDLIAAFKATFEEAADADLLLHVVDAADARYEDQMETTEKLLEELGLNDLPRLLAFNKCDLAPPGVGAALARAHDGIALSALDRESFRALLVRLTHVLFESPRVRKVETTQRPWALPVG
jgi:50S ribosomal subunit-associated GTPase HflX